MKKSKIIFLVLAGIFIVLMIVIGYDISSRTTWPGSKPQLKERLMNTNSSKDSANVEQDTIRTREN